MYTLSDVYDTRVCVRQAMVPDTNSNTTYTLWPTYSGPQRNLVIYNGYHIPPRPSFELLIGLPGSRYHLTGHIYCKIFLGSCGVRCMQARECSSRSRL
jgi:hypothetical protein